MTYRQSSWVGKLWLVWTTAWQSRSKKLPGTVSKRNRGEQKKHIRGASPRGRCAK